MATLLDILASGTSGAADYYNDNPFYAAGNTILRTQLPVAQTNSQALLMPFIQGLVGGGLTGYGQRQATEQAYQDYSKNPLLGALGTYGAEMPSGWSPDVGRKDLLLETLRQQDEQEIKARQNEIALKYALENSPENILAKAKAEAQGKAEGEMTIKGKEPEISIKDLPAEAQNKIYASKAVIDEAREISTELKKIGPSWTELQGSKYFSGLDKKGVGLALSNLADRLARARSGAALNDAEVELYNKLVKGDVTASPSQVANLLEKLANSEIRFNKSVLSTVRASKSGNIEDIFKETSAQTKLPISREQAIAELKRRGL